MVNTLPNLYPEGRYNGKQTAEALGIHPETLRRYVNDGRIRQRFGKHSSRPYYLGRDILTLWRVG